jgi:selenocysteine lyase/cysteine desulfurase
VLAAAPALLETLRPDKLEPSSDAVPERFELGTLPYELLAGTTAAVEVLAGIGGSSEGDRRSRLVRSMGLVASYEDGLRRRIEEGLASIPGVTVYSRAVHRTPTLLLEVAGIASPDVYAFLAERGVNAPAGTFYALEASRRLGLGDSGAVRVGLAPYLDEGDVDRLLAGLRELTAGTAAG